MPRTNTIKAELIAMEDIPTRKSRYDWVTYFAQLEANPDKALKFTGVARTTVNDAVIAYNENEENKRTMLIRGKRRKEGNKTIEEIYVSFAPEEEPPKKEE